MASGFSYRIRGRDHRPGDQSRTRHRRSPRGRRTARAAGIGRLRGLGCAVCRVRQVRAVPTVGRQAGNGGCCTGGFDCLRRRHGCRGRSDVVADRHPLFACGCVVLLFMSGFRITGPGPVILVFAATGAAGYASSVDDLARLVIAGALGVLVGWAAAMLPALVLPMGPARLAVARAVSAVGASRTVRRRRSGTGARIDCQRPLGYCVEWPDQVDRRSRTRTGGGARRSRSGSSGVAVARATPP